MSSPILVAKHFIPTTRTRLVSRSRLVNQFNKGLCHNQGFESKLTLVSAPADFGKTTLVTEWVQVKAHSCNIYGKLGVKNHTQAAARALGLLRSPYKQITNQN